jgi:hypothetical protein
MMIFKIAPAHPEGLSLFHARVYIKVREPAATLRLGLGG